MRLVSAIWADFHPFFNLVKVNDFAKAVEPQDLRENDILIVWGGADIHPSFYNKKHSKFSGASREPSQRDRAEWALMHRAKELGLPIIGVCRGGQMLSALAGGSLIQHVNGHGGYHDVTTYDNKKFRVNSLHHQMMHPLNTNHSVIAWSSHKRSDVYYDEDTNVDVTVEPEFIHFHDVKGFAIQWHPEMLDDQDPSSLYINDYINQRL
jgi:gamma-glutamyl-gamma-aminobutyrate hydrolase PuuD